MSVMLALRGTQHYTVQKIDFYWRWAHMEELVRIMVIDKSWWGQEIDKCIYLWERNICILEIGSCIYRSWEVTWFTIYKLENQENQWYDFVQVQRPEDEGKWWYNTQGKAESLRSREATGVNPRVPRLENKELRCQEREKIYPSSTFLFYSGL